MPRVNLVLQGGGVKGAAYVGALEAIESAPRLSGVEIAGIGGSSAGAIVAALYAAGYSAAELRAEIFKRPLGSMVKRSWRPLAWELVRSKGIYSTEPIHAWLSELLARKSVESSSQLRMPCRILAADVSHRRYCKFLEHEDYPVAKAVLRSLSIPIFFQPYVDGNDLYVDGGMLSNFPMWMFEDSDLPTVGLRLDGGSDYGSPGVGPRSGIADYLTSLVTTMLEAHDATGRGTPPASVEIPIDTLGVRATEFGLGNERLDELRESGYRAVESFDWSTLPPGSEIVFNDKRAAEILEGTSNALQTLFERTKDAALRQREYANCDVTFRIFEDGSGAVEDRVDFTNHGPGALSMLCYELAYSRQIDFSLMDLEVEVRCQGAGHDAVWLPFKNTRIEKGVLIAFVPPVEPGDRRELFVKRLLPMGFLDYASGRVDEIGLQQEHEKGIQSASLLLEIDPRVGPARIVNTSGNAVPVTGPPARGEPSNSFRWDFRQAPARELTFNVRIQRT